MIGQMFLLQMLDLYKPSLIWFQTRLKQSFITLKSV